MRVTVRVTVWVTVVVDGGGGGTIAAGGGVGVGTVAVTRGAELANVGIATARVGTFGARDWQATRVIPTITSRPIRTASTRITTVRRSGRSGPGPGIDPASGIGSGAVGGPSSGPMRCPPISAHP